MVSDLLCGFRRKALILFRLEFGLVLLSLGPLMGDLHLLNRVNHSVLLPTTIANVFIGMRRGWNTRRPAERALTRSHEPGNSPAQGRISAHVWQGSRQCCSR